MLCRSCDPDLAGVEDVRCSSLTRRHYARGPHHWDPEYQDLASVYSGCVAGSFVTSVRVAQRPASHAQACQSVAPGEEAK